MDVDVQGITIAELDAYGIAYGDLVATALEEVFAETLRGSPDALVAAGWRDALRGLRDRIAPSDVASLPSRWRERVSGLSAGVWNLFGASATRTRTDSVPAVPPPAAWMERMTTGPDAIPREAAVRDWRARVQDGMPLVPGEAAAPVMADTTLDLINVGDELWGRALEAIAVSAARGEDEERLAERLAEALEISQARARAIARTETARAANAASLAQMRAAGLTGVKIWQTVGDAKVRSAHAAADTQERNVADAFEVGGFSMQYPGDPVAPPELRINCRCDMGYRLPATQTPAWAEALGAGLASPGAAPEWPRFEGEDATEELTIMAAANDSFQSRMPRQLKDYWLNGEGALLIAWGTPGAFDRCVSALSDDFPQDTQGLCANLYHEATGRWPGEGKASVHTGGMIALVPHAEEPERFTVDGGLPGEEMHVTLAYLGDDVTSLPMETREAIVGAARGVAAATTPLGLDAFSVNVFNPGTANDRTPCVVMGVSGDGIADLHAAVADIAREHVGDVVQHTPFIPHMTLYYAEDGDMAALTDRVGAAFDMTGPVRFDRLRVAFADEVIDIPLYVESDPDDVDDVDECPDPDDDGEWAWERQLVLEGVESGDGRLFLPGSLVMESPPLPLAWQEFTAPGHDNSVSIGRIDEVWRDGDVVMGRGVVGLDTSEGRRAARGMCRGYQRGISIDADMIGGEVFDDGTGRTTEVYTSGRIRGATVVMTPAYTDGATMEIPDTRNDVASVTAACGCAADVNDHVIVIPSVPPAEWFAEPTDVEMHGALTVTDQGRVFGYLAPDNVAHRSFRDRVVTVPRGVDYSEFLGGETIVAGGGRVVTGPITMGCGHASTRPGVDAMAASEHYDNTCSVAANITVGENEHGVWVAGALVPGVTPDQVVRMMGCRLSGDWRESRREPGVRELTAALLVPTPGFATTRARASVEVSEGVMVASSVPVEFAITPHVVVTSAAPDPLRVVADGLARTMKRDPASRVASLVADVHGRD